MLICRTKCTSIITIKLEEKPLAERLQKKNSNLIDEEYSKCTIELILGSSSTHEIVKRATFIPNLFTYICATNEGRIKFYRAPPSSDEPTQCLFTIETDFLTPISTLLFNQLGNLMLACSKDGGLTLWKVPRDSWYSIK